jgi:hypothetical protein
MKGSGSNKHIAHVWVVTEAVTLHQSNGHRRNSFVDMQYWKFVDVLLHFDEFFFIAHPTKEFRSRNTADEKVLFTKPFTRCSNFFVSLIEFNNDIGINDYNPYLRQDFSRMPSEVSGLFFPEPKVSQKSFLEKVLVLISSGLLCERTSKANTSTVLPTKFSGKIMETFFCDGIMISLCTSLVRALIVRFLLAKVLLSFLIENIKTILTMSKIMNAVNIRKPGCISNCRSLYLTPSERLPCGSSSFPSPDGEGSRNCAASRPFDGVR